MRASQKLREPRACVAKLPPRQRICHPEEPPSLAGMAQNMEPARALEQRSGKGVSQDGVGALFFLDVLQLCSTEKKHPPEGSAGIFLFNSSSEGEGGKIPDARLLQLSAGECPLVWRHEDLVTREMLEKSKCRCEQARGWNASTGCSGEHQQKSPQSQPHCFQVRLDFTRASLRKSAAQLQTSRISSIKFR